MKPRFEELQQELKARRIPLSHQRLKVLEYLTEHRSHPTVDQIYTGLQQEVPTLSKTTVYNTLRLLVEEGLVRALTIEDTEARYDIVTETHGHFKCADCGTIYNFQIDPDLLVSRELDQFQIDDKSVYFKGTCPTCLLNEKKHQ